VTLDARLRRRHRRLRRAAAAGAGSAPGSRAGIAAAFTELHRLGFAHSVEVWDGELLVGGLYGLAIGAVFFGESMFSREPGASKRGFIALARQLDPLGLSS
jgi:leucyl/phenylalanyl-tRNA--protein transferase